MTKNSIQSPLYLGSPFCFAAGTLVHVKGGLKPIEDIRVGDMVLSQPEIIGELTHKPVVRRVQFDDKAVIRVSCHPVGFGERARTEGRWLEAHEMQTLIVTGNHPFYLAGFDTTFWSPEGWAEDRELYEAKIGWMRADMLAPGYRLRAANGDLLQVTAVESIWRTQTEGVGWIAQNQDSESGYLIDLRDGRIEEATTSVVGDFVSEDDFYYRYEDETAAEKWAFKLPVYNIEVEDFHTYYVGAHGAWAHGICCDS